MCSLWTAPTYICTIGVVQGLEKTYPSKLSCFQFLGGNDYIIQIPRGLRNSESEYPLA